VQGNPRQSSPSPSGPPARRNSRATVLASGAALTVLLDHVVEVESGRAALVEQGGDTGRSCWHVASDHPSGVVCRQRAACPPSRSDRWNLSPQLQPSPLELAELLVYECEGTETEIKEWFRTINIAGVPLNAQELLNAIYSGPFVTKAKAEFSNSNNANIQKWAAYVKGDPKRQEVLAVALEWVATARGKTTDAYLAQHRTDDNIHELKTYFTSVIDWIDSVFTGTLEKEMRGLEWGRLYEEYHGTAYDAAKLAVEVEQLLGDSAVTKRRGVYEYLLSGETKPELLEVRLFDDKTKQAAYSRQTKAAEASGVSNCPLCAVGGNANKTRHYKLAEMEADHVAAWSKGGKTDLDNCEMLCVPHNRSKGNR